MHKLLKMYLPRSKSMENKKTKFLSDDDKSFFFVGKGEKTNNFYQKKKTIHISLSIFHFIIACNTKKASYVYALLN